MRHLTVSQAEAALVRGAGIEQMLTTNLTAGRFSWLSAAPTAGGFELRRFEVLDDGSDDFLDVYEFAPVDEDEHLGEGVVVGHFLAARELLESTLAIGSRLDRWVNAGVIQDEYADLRRRGGGLAD